MPVGKGVGPSVVGRLLRDRSLRLAAGLAIAVAIPVTEESSLEAIKLCVEHGVDINAFNATGTTALHNAVNR